MRSDDRSKQEQSTKSKQTRSTWWKKEGNESYEPKSPPLDGGGGGAAGLNAPGPGVPCLGTGERAGFAVDWIHYFIDRREEYIRIFNSRLHWAHAGPSPAGTGGGEGVGAGGPASIAFVDFIFWRRGSRLWTVRQAGGAGSAGTGGASSGTGGGGASICF